MARTVGELLASTWGGRLPLLDLRVGLLALVLGCAQCLAQAPAPQQLRAQMASLRASATPSLFEQSVYLQSSEGSGSSHGEVYATLDRPLSELREALTPPGNWCAVLLLHLNVQDCRADDSPSGASPARLSVGIGRKTEQAVADLYRVNFSYSVLEAADDHLRIALRAPSGPLGTRDFRIELEAVQADIAGRSIIRMSYGYGYGLAARLAMQTYLSTVARDKIGFSTNGVDADGKPAYIGGMQALLERNTVRYFLAIRSFLDSRSLSREQQQAASLASWFDATERYPLQLHEVSRSEYLAMKQREMARTARQVAVAP